MILAELEGALLSTPMERSPQDPAQLGLGRENHVFLTGARGLGAGGRAVLEGAGL